MQRAEAGLCSCSDWKNQILSHFFHRQNEWIILQRPREWMTKKIIIGKLVQVHQKRHSSWNNLYHRPLIVFYEWQIDKRYDDHISVTNGVDFADDFITLHGPFSF